MKTELLSILQLVTRILSFRATEEELQNFTQKHLIFGLIFTWLAGIGRSWDDHTASLLRHSGIGSVVYVFALSLLLYLVVKPLSTKPYSYREMLNFVSLTSPPALLYAIPVDLFLPPETARTINLVFLAIVAAWRVALLIFYLRRAIGLNTIELIVSTLLPLSIVMAPLYLMQMASKIFEAMAGLREGRTLFDPVEVALSAVGTIAFYAVIPLLIIHIVLWRRKHL